jgi:hypothetical protein
MSAKKSNSVDSAYLNSSKVKKGKDDFLEETKSWKGGSHKERKEAQAQSMRSLKKKIREQPEKVSRRTQLIGMGIVGSICIVGLLQFLSTVSDFISNKGVVAIDVKDTAKLKSVLFGGDPWLIYCVNNETVNQRLPRVLEDSTSTLWSSLGVRVGVLKCWDRMESGRSVVQRFKLKMSPPLTFAVANGDSPRLVDMIGVSKTEHLEKKLKPLLKVQTERIDSLKKWPSKCTGRRTCIVVGYKQTAQKDTAMNLLKPFVEKHRTIKFVTLDTSFWQLKLDEGILSTRPGREEEKQRGADVMCLARDEGSSGNATFSGTFMQQLTASAAASFIKACADRVDLVQMPAAPKISARPSKPKVVKPDAPKRAAARPAPRPPPRDTRTNVDRVGSRAEMERQEQEEALFEAVEEESNEEEGAEEEGDADDEDGQDDGSSDEEVEL